MQRELDDKDIAICNHCDCERKLDCKRYRPEILACYDFEVISKTFDCFMQKEQ